MVSSNYFTKFHDFSMIIQFFSNSMIFPCMELFLVIFQVFHDFQSLWEPWTLHNCFSEELEVADRKLPDVILSFQDMRSEISICELAKKKITVLELFSVGPFYLPYFPVGAQWPSSRVLDSRPRGCGLEPHRRHSVVHLNKIH